MICEFQRFHNTEDEEFDKYFIYGNIHIGIVLFNVQNQLHYCVDIRDLQNYQHLHMDRMIFEKCVERLSALTSPDIPHLHTLQSGDFTIKQIPHTNCYKAAYHDQNMIFDLHTIESITDIWHQINSP